MACTARHGSPAPGGSILITSAPKSERMVAAQGPAIQLAQSMTFRPVKRESVMGVSGGWFLSSAGLGWFWFRESLTRSRPASGPQTEEAGGHGVFVPRRPWDASRFTVRFALDIFGRFAYCGTARRPLMQCGLPKAAIRICRTQTQPGPSPRGGPAKTPCPRPSSVQGPLAGRLRARFSRSQSRPKTTDMAPDSLARPDQASWSTTSHRRAVRREARTTLWRLIAEDDRPRRREHPAHAMADRDLRTLHLRRRDPAHLPHAFLQRVHPVHARVHIRQSAAVGVQRQRPARRRVPSSDEAGRLAARQEAQILQPIDRQMREG